MTNVFSGAGMLEAKALSGKIDAMTKRLTHISCLALACALGAPARAEIRALLVGVSDYHYLDADLRGPANDVGLMARALIARGAKAADIVVLAAPDAPLPEGVANAGAPTRAAIMAGLDALAATSSAETHAVFYFSGHGTQMPDMNGDEQGGFDEIFLPADARGWSGAAGTVENAIIDDEMTPKMQAILDTGAQLVAMLDACHSETGFRALPNDPAAPVARYIAPALLAMPDEMPEATGDAPPAQPLTGDFVFLYAAQQNQRAFEYPMGDPSDDANWYGDFTRTVTSALESGAALTWADVLQKTMAEMNANSPATQTPDAEGTLLEASVLGQSEPTPPVLRLEGGKLQSGSLQGVQIGAVYEISASAGGEVIAEATVSAVKPTSASLQSDTGLPGKGFARLKTPGRPAPVRLAGPVLADDADYGALVAEIDRLKQAAAPDGVEWTDGPADVTLVLTGGALALAGRDGVIDGAGPGSAPRVAAAEDVLAFLDRAARTLRLRQAVSQVSSGKTGFALPGFGPKYELSHVPVRGDATCAEGAAGAQQTVTKTVTVTHCDQLWLSVHNATRTPRDVTVLYIDADNAITAIWPEEGLSNRVGFDERIEAGLLIQNPAQRNGLEEILVLAVPARDKAPRTVLTALADPVPTRDVPQGTPGAASWLLQATLPDAATRNLSLPGAMSTLEVTRFSIKLEPD
ncbi:MAG: caspase family protein [Rhodobacteraceae bacterium]|nr:MAG: caspase family protein [Paracoccaceae bacterium]